MTAEAGMNKQEEDRRKRLLRRINAELASRHLKIQAKLGLASAGEIEITGFPNFFAPSDRFFTDVRFPVRFPGGATGLYAIRYNANGDVSDGAVLVVKVNGKFAFIKQHRLPLS